MKYLIGNTVLFFACAIIGGLLAVTGARITGMQTALSFEPLIHLAIGFIVGAIAFLVLLFVSQRVVVAALGALIIAFLAGLVAHPILEYHYDSQNERIKIQNNSYLAEVRLVIPKGRYAGFHVLIGNHGESIKSSFEIDDRHDLVFLKKANGWLDIMWGPLDLGATRYTDEFRLVPKSPAFGRNKDRKSVVVGYIKLNGVDEEIEVVLRE